MENLPTLDRYRRHLRATGRWLVRSVRPGGGSAAYFSPLAGWSRPYPETTGYLIPTLLRLGQEYPADGGENAAFGAGRWLLEIQRPEGAWNGGLHPPRGGGKPSVFNTGQVLDGMLALYRHTKDPRWLEAAARGAGWLAAGMGADGLWAGSDYRAAGTPSYYTHVLWPMLEVWKETGDSGLLQAARRGLDAIVARRAPNGVIRGWGFREGEPAFTHVIAYTLRGIQECARLLDAWDELAPAVAPALERLVRRGELAGGRLPGAFDDQWRAHGRYVCLTGNAQLALCILVWEEREPDLRLVSAAARLVDAVCDTQRTEGRPAGLCGGVAGSSPPWGGYMRLRYPNWAAKYLCDALLRLEERVRAEL